MQHAPGQRIEDLEPLDLVVGERDADRVLGVLRREHVDHVAADAERSALEVELAALVLHHDQPRDDLALGELLLVAQVQDHAVVLARVADAVDCRHRRDDHAVAPLEQRLRRRQAHLFDVLVDRAVFLDVQVARRHVGFRLVVVVVRDEVLDRVFREELAKLGIKLRGQRLVRRQHERGAPEVRDHVRHRVSLARPGHAEERLERKAVADSLDELRDRLRLVARGRKGLVQLERAVGERIRHG